MNKIKIFIGALVLLFSGVTVSCTNLLETTASNEAPAGDAIGDPESAQSALYGVYDRLQHQYIYGQYVYLYGEVRADDMQPISRQASRPVPLYTYNNRTPSTGLTGNFWQALYNGLNRANKIVEAFENETVKYPESQDGQVLYENVYGQALSLRALLHHTVVINFGKPYTMDSSAPGAIVADHVFTSSEKPARSTVSETYDFIVQDLTDAIDLLESSKPTTPSAQYGYMNYYAAKALLARVYLYMGDWGNALTQAEDVINSNVYTLVPADKYVDSWYDHIDGATSESIFSIINTETDNIGRESMCYLQNPDGYGELIITTAMVDLLKEYAADVRADLIDLDDAGLEGWYKKYPALEMANNNPVFRLAEMYLIAAEAALKSNNQTKADKYFNDLRGTRIPGISDVTATENLIINERRKELVGEGHRFYDVMRLGLTVRREGGRHFLNLDELIEVNRNNHLTVLPIPSVEINGNPDIEQNDGYGN